MYRREFLGAGSALVAGAFLPQSAEAAARRQAPTQAIDSWLAELDLDLDRMRRRRPIRPVRRRLQAAGLHPQLIGESMAALSLASEWKDSSEAVQQHPAFVARMLQAAEQLGTHMLALTRWMRHRPRAERRRQARVLRSPNHATALMDAAIIRKGRHADPRRRHHLRNNAGIIAKALRNRDDDDLIARLVAEMDQAEEAVHHDPNPELDAAISLALAPPPASDAADGAPDQKEDRKSSDSRITRVGLRMLGIGAILEGVGLAMVGIAALTGAEALLFASMPLSLLLGPILLILGLIVVIVGANEPRPGGDQQAGDSPEARFFALLDSAGPPDPADLLPA